jgi:hypothetical protein
MRTLSPCSSGFHDASGRFSFAAEEWLATASFEGSLKRAAATTAVVASSVPRCGMSVLAQKFRSEKLKNDLHPQQHFVELIIAEFRIGFAKIRPCVHVVGHQF